MAIELSTPDVGQLGDVVRALRDWQHDALPMQLHPGDLGWFWRFGAAATAAAVRTWSRGGHLVAVGLLDGPGVFRMTVAPEVRREEDLAQRIVTDVSEPGRGVLPAGKVAVESPDGTRVQELLTDAGWRLGESWTPLRRDLTGPVDETAMRIEVIDSSRVPEFTSVHRSAWGSSRFTDERWRAMAAGLPYADGRCLLAYDERGDAVAGVTVWSSGPGRPGLIEPLGVHPAHRRRGYGRAICVAAAAHLHELGSSSVLVCTESARSSAVATYRSAGFHQLPERLDRTRDARFGPG